MTRKNSVARATKLPQLKTGWLLWAILGLVVAARSISYVSDITENDVFLHTLLGEWILGGGATTGNPSWTYAPSQTGWVNTLVIPELVFAQLHAWFGWGGITLVRVVAVPIAAVASWYAISRFAPTPSARYRQTAGLIAVVSITFYLALYGWSMSIRPQALSFAIVPLLVLALVRIMHLGRFPNIILVAVVTWAWTCWHGYGVLVGPLFLLAGAVYLLARTMFATKGSRGQTAKSALVSLLKQAWTPLVAIAVTFLTPAGVGLWTSAGRIREASVTLISEWQPTLSVALHGGLGFAITTLAIVLWIGAALPALRHPRSLSRGAKLSLATDILFILALLAVFFSTERTAVFASAIIFYLAVFRAMRSYLPLAYRRTARQSLSPLVQRITSVGNRTARLIAAAVLAAATIIVICIKLPGVGYSPEYFPQKLIDGISSQSGQHKVFVDWDASSNLLYQMQQSGNGQTSIDGRTDYYGATTLAGIGMLDHNTPRWDEYFAPYSSSTDALIKTSTEAYSRLIKAGWTVQGTQVAGQNRLTHEPNEWVWLTAPTK